MQPSSGFNLISFSGKMKILHLSWMVFFISFFVWFNHAPLLGAIAGSLGITMAQVKTLLILNVALTIPARVVVGMLTDKFGPRIVYAALLILCSIPCFMFAMATTFEQAAIARFALGFIGAGFVVGSYLSLATALLASRSAFLMWPALGSPSLSLVRRVCHSPL